MIMVKNKISLCFPEIHHHAVLELVFTRTLRVPNNEKAYTTPPGFDAFSLISESTELAEDPYFALPMWPSDAMWMKLINKAAFPFAIKVDYDGRCAVTAGPYREALIQGVSRTQAGTIDLQNFLVSPGQVSLDGVCLKEGIFEQFVIDSGASPIESSNEHCLRITVYPMKKAIYQEVLRVEGFHPNRETEGHRWTSTYQDFEVTEDSVKHGSGRVTQTIASSERHVDVWDLEAAQTVTIDLIAMHEWLRDPKHVVPHQVYSKAMYERLRYPWFDWYEPIQWDEVKEKGAEEKKEGGGSDSDEVKEPNTNLKERESDPTPLKGNDVPSGWWKIEGDRGHEAKKTVKEQPSYKPTPLPSAKLNHDYQFGLSPQIANFDVSYRQKIGVAPTLNQMQQKEKPKPTKRPGFWERLFSSKE